MAPNKVTKGQRKLHNKELHNLYYSLHVSRMGSFFCNTMLYSLLKVKWCFGGACYSTQCFLPGFLFGLPSNPVMFLRYIC
jgi:hypothetical protein